MIAFNSRDNVKSKRLNVSKQDAFRYRFEIKRNKDTHKNKHKQSKKKKNGAFQRFSTFYDLKNEMHYRKELPLKCNIVLINTEVTGVELRSRHPINVPR